MIRIKSFTFNPFMENTYLLYDETGEGVIIDPGCYEKYECSELSSFIEENNIRPKLLLNTHCHIDHVFGNHFVKETYDIPLLAHKLDVPTLASVKVYAPVYGFQNYQETEVDQFLDEGDSVEFGKSNLAVLFVPGHAPGHIAFVNQDENICMAGDVLFDGSIGRTDLPGGSFDTLIESIHNKIFPLGDEMVVWPGHGPETTVGKEKVSNPFCAISQ
jgi:glyoxylase-like metal-dependent hydrolase (beta-lactamase superfamily II)